MCTPRLPGHTASSLRAWTATCSLPSSSVCSRYSTKHSFEVRRCQLQTPLLSSNRRESGCHPEASAVPSPQGLHSWWKAWPAMLGKCHRSQSGGLQWCAPHSLWTSPRLPGKADRCAVHKLWLAQLSLPLAPSSFLRVGSSGRLPASTVCRQLLGSLSQPLQVVNAESIETETQTVPTVPLGEGGAAWPCQSH